MKKVVCTYLSFLILNITVNAQKQWSLDECIYQACTQNAGVIIQQMRNEVSEEKLKMAKNDRLPTANFNLSQNFSLGNSFNASTNIGQLSFSSTFLSLNAGVVLFDGFRYRNNLQKSAVSAQLGKTELEVLRLDLSLEVIEKYLQILYLKETLKVAEEQVMITKQNLDRLQKLNQQAFANKRDLLEMEATLASEEKEVIVVKNNLANSLIGLAVLLHLTEPSSFDIQVLSQPLEPVKSDSYLNPEVRAIDIQQHPKLQSAAQSILLKRSEMELAKANFYPNISLGYSLNSNYFHVLGQRDLVYNQDTKQMEPNGLWRQLDNNHIHFLGFSALVPIFNKFHNKQNLQIARDELRIADMELERQQLELLREIRVAQNDLEAAWANVKVAEIALAAQKNAFAIINEKYRNGNLSNFEFLEGKSRLISKSSEFIKAKYNCLFKAKVLELHTNYAK